VSDLQSDLLGRFRWVDGHADVWRLFYDNEVFARLVVALADPFRADGIMKVAGIEARGFIFPGAKLLRRTGIDYRGRDTELRLQRDSVTAADRVLLVDDWFETGSQGLAAKALIEAAGGELAGVSVIVDQLPAATRSAFGRYHALIPSSALPNSAASASAGHS
jgi:adenine phosphoribosyltransferase